MFDVNELAGRATYCRLNAIFTRIVRYLARLPRAQRWEILEQGIPGLDATTWLRYTNTTPYYNQLLERER